MAQAVLLTTVQAVIARALTTGIHDRGRIERAATVIALGAVSRVDASTFTVRSQFQPDTANTVTSNGCTRVDAARNPAKRCKHDLAVRILPSAQRDDAAQREPAARSHADAERVPVAYATAAGRAA